MPQSTTVDSPVKVVLTYLYRCSQLSSAGQRNRNDCDQDDKQSHDIRHWPVSWTGQLAEDPDRQRGLLPGSKRKLQQAASATSARKAP